MYIAFCTICAPVALYSKWYGLPVTTNGDAERNEPFISHFSFIHKVKEDEYRQKNL